MSPSDQIPPEDSEAKAYANQDLTLEQWRQEAILQRSEKKIAEHERDTDPIMNIPTNRFFNRILGKSIEEVRQNPGRELSGVFLDLDKFGDFNKLYGQATGDAALKHAADVIKHSLRQEDILSRMRLQGDPEPGTPGRLGGEEIFVLLKTNLSGAARVAHRIISNLAATPFETETAEGKKQLIVTASAGVSTLANGIKDGPALIHAANEAMRASKERGRNQVHIQDPNSPGVFVRVAPTQRAPMLGPRRP